MSWTPIEKLMRDIPLNNPNFQQNVRIRPTLFPLISCEAITINKDQEQSIDDVVVNISPNDKNMMLSHVYVALSCAQTANGLYIDSRFFLPNAVIEI